MENIKIKTQIGSHEPLCASSVIRIIKIFTKKSINGSNYRLFETNSYCVIKNIIYHFPFALNVFLTTILVRELAIGAAKYINGASL